MSKPLVVAWIVAAGLMMQGAATVSGQNFPNKPIRLITSEVGGTADFTARAFAQELTGNLGQQVIVENRGGIANIRTLIVVKAVPDGYTLFLSGNVLWILPLMQKIEYRSGARSCADLIGGEPTLVLVVHPAVAAKSVKELIALAKSKPGELNYASGAPGGATPLAGYLFNAMAGVNIVHVFYKGSGPGLTSSDRWRSTGHVSRRGRGCDAHQIRPIEGFGGHERAAIRAASWVANRRGFRAAWL